MTELLNHSMIVNYGDPSADAAISGTAKDLKFTNNLIARYISKDIPHPISILHLRFTVRRQDRLTARPDMRVG